jgi:TatD DNase family protein
MIDTHAHKTPLSSGHLPLTGATDKDLIIDGLDFVVLSGSNLDDSRENVELAKSNPNLCASVGIHPQEINSKKQIYNFQILTSKLEELLENNKEIVAVGECGMDFSDEYDKEGQEKMFRAQIELAIKYDKTLIVHSRKAMDETLAILGDYQNVRGVIHCYTGGIKRINKVVELGPSWFFGIDGNLTYEGGLVEVVKNIPKDRLVLETDSPFLTPVPFRGQPNCPANVKYVYQKVAEIWAMSFEETEKIIDGNAKKLFKFSVT